MGDCSTFSSGSKYLLSVSFCGLTLNSVSVLSCHTDWASPVWSSFPHYGQPEPSLAAHPEVFPDHHSGEWYCCHARHVLSMFHTWVLLPYRCLSNTICFALSRNLRISSVWRQLSFLKMKTSKIYVVCFEISKEFRRPCLPPQQPWNSASKSNSNLKEICTYCVWKLVSPGPAHLCQWGPLLRTPVEVSYALSPVLLCNLHSPVFELRL